MLHASGKLIVDLEAIARNYHLISSQTDTARVGAVVKADAYGLGAAEIGAVLAEEGCTDFFVATPAEGVALRPVVGPRAGIYILNGFYGTHAELYPKYNLIPALGSFMEMEGYQALGRKTGRALPAWLSFNTRMNRLGLGEVETRELLADKSRLAGIDVTGVMSHFACADEEHELNDIQADIFAQIAAHFPEAEKSLSNSPGTFRSRTYHFDVLRAGMALYGLNPAPGTPNPMRRVVSLQLPVIRRRLVYKGASVGYNATYSFEKETELATVSAGYADGILRSLSNRGKLYWHGYPCPIRGRVSMDLTTVDLSAVPAGELPRPGDFMELLGPNQSADDLAEDAGTIGYEILTSLGKRYERSYFTHLKAASQAAGPVR